jgi:hypothetical protein
MSMTETKICIRHLAPFDLLDLAKWRTHPVVDDALMHDVDKLPLLRQIWWYLTLDANYWPLIIEANGEKVAYASLHLKRRNKRALAALFLNPNYICRDHDQRSKFGRLGQHVYCLLMHVTFDKLNYHKLQNYILEHGKFWKTYQDGGDIVDAIEIEGTLKDHVFKRDKAYTVIVANSFRHNWQVVKDKFFKELHHHYSELEVDLPRLERNKLA